jgi:hypothetical protein
MRLWILSENIRQRDFFDLYALIYGYQDPQQDPTRKQEISQRLKEQIDYIYNDHMQQLSSIIISRLMPDDNAPPIFREICFKHGIDIDRYDEMMMNGEYEPVNLSPEAARSFISDIVKASDDIQEKFSYQYFTAGDGAWAKLARQYLKLSQAGTSIEGRIIAIDSIYGLLHHGGMILDYFDESKWLENALNIRANAGAAGLLQYASSDVKNLVGHAGYGMAEPRVSPLKKLHTALDRYFRRDAGHLQIQLTNDGITISGSYIFFRIPGVYQGSTWNTIHKDLMKYAERAGVTPETVRVPFTANIIETKPLLKQPTNREIKTRRTSEPVGRSEFAISVDNGDYQALYISYRHGTYTQYCHKIQEAITRSYNPPQEAEPAPAISEPVAAEV